MDALLIAIAKSAAPLARQAVLDGLADGFAGRRKVAKPASWSAIETQLADGSGDPLKNRIRDLSALFGDGRALEQIKEVALNTKADLPLRRTALQSLIDARADGLRGICEQLLSVRDISAVAASGLALFDDSSIADRLIAEWPNLYGAEKPPVMNALLSRPAWTMKLLAAIAAGKFRRTDLGVPQARQIRGLNNEALTRRLTDVWGAMQDTDEAARQQALRRWQQKLTPEALERANLIEGQKLYALSCALTSCMARAARLVPTSRAPADLDTCWKHSVPERARAGRIPADDPTLKTDALEWNCPNRNTRRWFSK